MIDVDRKVQRSSSSYRELRRISRRVAGFPENGRLGYTAQTQEQADRARATAQAKRGVRGVRNVLLSWRGSLHKFSGVA